MFGSKEKRFEIKHTDNIGMGTLNVIVDKETGVHYLMTIGSGPSSITPLLDKNGQIVIEKVY